MGKAKDGSVSVSFSMSASEEALLEAVCSIKMTTRSAYMRSAFWERLARDLVDIPRFRKLISDHVTESISDQE